mmetsp:Transcript_40075/g.55686  ORF Transcript_40075/g.55686 Transcript_40075/m.55686 type:complete len:195 (+) Transcript_40075:76-660(+)|eukprot:CAMPEP_0196580896 /NCGR_PEP_ID=MMETSP1081-20130531/31329_1 /TAXON_ID=36882 /ORGANISM="Pyramimonas amylifera, Strain CCMP720" /LENGTH=194 /DNA_ID=CAMNT_0041900921 /DNA_START=76 /DNA_END=660 /DNA_ORIENTATION=+
MLATFCRRSQSGCAQTKSLLTALTFSCEKASVLEQFSNLKFAGNFIKRAICSSSVILKNIDSEFVLERKAYREKLHELRKEFEVEVESVYSAKAEAKAKKMETERVAIQEAKAEWKALKSVRAAENIEKFNQMVAQKAQERVERKELTLMKLQDLEAWRTKQRQCMEDDSLNWVEEHELERRIELALDNPRSLM